MKINSKLNTRLAITRRWKQQSVPQVSSALARGPFNTKMKIQNQQQSIARLRAEAKYLKSLPKGERKRALCLMRHGRGSL
jgi:hypothetical protein